MTGNGAQLTVAKANRNYAVVEWDNIDTVHLEAESSVYRVGQVVLTSINLTVCVCVCVGTKRGILTSVSKLLSISGSVEVRISFITLKYGRRETRQMQNGRYTNS